MILQHLPLLAEKRIILASASPRRKELLGNLGIKFEVMVSAFEENLPKSSFSGGAAYALATARAKALDVAHVCSAQGDRVDLIISADTVVEVGDEILEKASDAAHAAAMLTSLSGRTHHVHTGVVLLLPHATDPATGSPPLVHPFSSSTAVTFADLSPKEIEAYIATGEAYGKAGSYGIQGAAGAWVRRVDGCYFTIVGFPVHQFAAELAALIQGGALPPGASSP